MSVKTGRSHSRPAAESGINGDEWIKVIYGLFLSVLVGNRMKREGKELHGASVKRIHEERQDPVEVINYTRLFDRLEKCTYNCKEVPIL